MASLVTTDSSADGSNDHPAQNMISNLKCVNDVRSLNAKQLTTALKLTNQQCTGKREHQIRVLCDVLGFGPDKTKFQEVLAFVKKTKKGWTKDIRKCPGVTLVDVTKYLLNSHDTVIQSKSGDLEIFSQATLRRYKTLRSYELYRSGHVHSITFQPMSDTCYCALKAKCNPSWDTSGTVYDCLLILTREGVPFGSSCTCTAGLGEACTHVAALLFALEDFTSLGYQPDDPASTEVLCAWNAPKSSKIEPMPLKELEDKNRAPVRNESKQCMKRKLAKHNPVTRSKRNVHVAHYHKLVHDLSLCQPDVPFLTIADPHRWDSNILPSGEIHSSLPVLIPATAPKLIPASDVTVTTTPSNPHCLLYKAKQFMTCRLQEQVSDTLVEQFMDSIAFTQSECDSIERLTVGQSMNAMWNQYRQGMITSSTIHFIHTRMNSIKSKRANDANRLVSLCLSQNQSFKGNQATRYGLQHEKDAARIYRVTMEQAHTNFSLTECGFKLSNNYPFLGSSVDRMAACSCHGERPVEIKCPSSFENKAKGSFSELGFLKLENNIFSLKTSHPYYTQVQCHMAVTGTSVCDFVVWSPSDTTIIPVSFDAMFWASILSNVIYFFKHFLAPKMLENACENIVPHISAQHERENFVKQYVCGNPECKSLLVDAENLDDDRDASVMCECVCGCGVWYHWECSNLRPLDIETESTDLAKWYCPQCVQSCDISNMYEE